MRVLIDADACPKAAKDVLFKISQRTSVELILVANQPIKSPPYPQITSIVVGQGYNVADDKLVELVQDNDLVITADIPLADRVVKKNAYALSPRGELFTEDNISNRLAMRDLFDELRNDGMVTGGPPPYSQRDRQNFNNTLDRFLTKHHKI